MSLILDALNRSERERNQHSKVPGLQASHGAVSGAPRVPPAALIVVALLVLAIVAFFFLRGESNGHSAPQAYAVPPVSQAEQAAPVQHPANNDVSERVASGLTAQSGTGHADSGPQSAAVNAAATSQTVTASLNNSRSLPKITGNPEVAALYAQPEAPAPVKKAKAEAARNNIIIEALPDKAASPPQEEQRFGEVENISADASGIPYITQLPSSVQDAIPTILFTKHMYSATNPGASAAVLNGRARMEGQEVVDGVYLEEIHAGHIVLNYQGTRFRLLRENSWINH